MEFDIIEDTNKKEFLKKLNEAAKEGWMPYKGLNTVVDDVHVVYTVLVFKGS